MLLKKTRQAKSSDKSDQMDRLMPSTAMASASSLTAPSSSISQGSSSRPQTPVTFKRESPGKSMPSVFVNLADFSILSDLSILSTLWISSIPLILSILLIFQVCRSRQFSSHGNFGNLIAFVTSIDFAEAWPSLFSRIIGYFRCHILSSPFRFWWIVQSILWIF